MFTLEIESDACEQIVTEYVTVTLHYTSDRIRFTFSPESDPLVIDGPSGRFDQGDSNGDVGFSWEGNTLTFYASKYGNGIGGSMSQDLVLNPEELESFHYCLRKWQALQQHFKNGKKSKDFVFE